MDTDKEKQVVCLLTEWSRTAWPLRTCIITVGADITSSRRATIPISRIYNHKEQHKRQKFGKAKAVDSVLYITKEKNYFLSIISEKYNQTTEKLDQLNENMTENSKICWWLCTVLHMSPYWYRLSASRANKDHYMSRTTLIHLKFTGESSLLNVIHVVGLNTRQLTSVWIIRCKLQILLYMKTYDV